MRWAGIIKNDVAAGPGVCVSVFVQGCPIHCPGCHNPETWAFDGGKEFTPDDLNMIIDALQANGVHRNLCIMGGEPMCTENTFLTLLIIKTVKERLPNTKVYIWTGFTIEYLETMHDIRIQQILELSDCLIDGPYLQKERDITLPMRGSRNQRIIPLDKYKNL